MSKETGGNAFPYSGEHTLHGTRGYSVKERGMSLRDYFAAKAAQGFIAGAMADGTTFGTSNDADVVASTAYLVADAMLKARFE